jgi:FKBP-type peptidyl-prolyl cis-trans isomerase 2
MTTNKNDFIELEFTGKITGTSEVFDTNILADAKLAGFKTEDMKPLILSIGQKMLPAGFDEDLENKEAEKKYELNLKPEKAFGKRNPQLIRMIPTKLFHEQKITPERGMQLNLDGQIVKVLSSDRGRTLTDFNNPLAGKNITYNYKINRIVTEEKEKINALQEFFFRQTFKFKKEAKKVTFSIPKEAEEFIKMFAPKFKEILDLEIDTKIEAKKSKVK